jgi:hypothetical protein
MSLCICSAEETEVRQVLVVGTLSHMPWWLRSLEDETPTGDVVFNPQKKTTRLLSFMWGFNSFRAFDQWKG